MSKTPPSLRKSTKALAKGGKGATPSFKEGSYAYLFVKLAKPDKNGVSRVVSRSEFVGAYAKLERGFGNGGSWSRTDGGSLGRYYKIKRIKENNRIAAVKLEGFRENPLVGIPAHIGKAIRERRCVVLGTSKPECDHKNGRWHDDPRFSDPSQLSEADFQPLSKAANDAKRQYCKECKATGLRFDATRLGYPVSQTEGGRKYTNTCLGCYWYNPLAFNQKISKGFKE